MKYKYRKYVTLSVFSLIVFFVTMAVRGCSPDEPASADDSASGDTFTSRRSFEVTRSAEPVHSYLKEFCDSQQVQIIAAKAMGVIPMHEDHIPSALNHHRLVELRDCHLFYLKDVDYPYLVADAYNLLMQIGRMYQVNVQNPYSRLRITSCLRTEDSIKRLRRHNVNSVTESCHLYGTTFDISYAQLEVAEKQALARALRDLRDAGHCYVKYERKQPCFHITVRPDPAAR